MKKNRIKKNKKEFGFTLVETIVVIGIFTLLAIGTTSLFTHIFISSQDRLASMDSIDYANAVATDFTNEIRVAKIGIDGAYPIGQADDQEIVFYSGYKQNAGQIARLRYYLNLNTLYKGVTIPSGNPLHYDLATEKIQTVENNVASTSAPIFYYYDGDYTGSSTALVQPINLNQIKYVKISLDILKQNTRTDTGTYNVTAGASIRNLKTNLGN